jgi:hypothetical protein
MRLQGQMVSFYATPIGGFTVPAVYPKSILTRLVRSWQELLESFNPKFIKAFKKTRSSILKTFENPGGFIKKDDKS